MHKFISRCSGRALALALMGASLTMAGPSFAADAQKAAEMEISVPSGRYVLDEKHASLIARISHLGLSQFTFRMNRFDVDLELNVEDPSQSTLEAAVDMTSIDTAMPDFDEKLQGDDWLKAADHPTAQYRSTRITQTGPRTATVHGELTLLGQTHPMDLNVVLTGAGKNFSGTPTVGFAATGIFKRGDYGVSKYLPNIGNEITVEINAELNKK